MSQSPEEIRDQIDTTRVRLSSDVDALADKVSPTSIAHRQTDRIRGSVDRVRERIMGAADDVGDAVRETSERTQEKAHDLPEKVARQTQGNPLAAGLIAFGAGWLLSTLVPPTETEKRAAETVKEKAQPLMQEAGEMARAVTEDMKEPMQDAVEQVKEAAQESAGNIKSESAVAAENVKDSTQAEQERFRHNAQGNETSI